MFPVAGNGSLMHIVSIDCTTPRQFLYTGLYIERYSTRAKGVILKHKALELTGGNDSTGGNDM
jgi:hypothetical protein